MGKNKFLGKSLSLIGSAAVAGSAFSGAGANANLLDDTLEKSFMYKFFRFFNLSYFMNMIEERAIRSLHVYEVLDNLLKLVKKKFLKEEHSVLLFGSDQKTQKGVNVEYVLNLGNNKYGFYFGDDEYILFEIIEKNNKDKPRIYGKRVFSFNIETGGTKEALEFCDRVELLVLVHKLRKFIDENKDLFSKDGEIKFDCIIDKQKLKKLTFDSDKKFILFSFQSGGLRLSTISRFNDQQERKYAINCIDTIIKQSKACKNVNVLKLNRSNEINNF